MKLPFHMPNQQMVIYNGDDPPDDILDRVTVSSSKFLAWMKCNSVYKDAKLLTYAEIPSKFVWNVSDRRWTPRRRGNAIGRITYVPMSVGEAYYLRILLNLVKGPETFNDIKTYKGVLYDSFKETCYAYGLLDDDREYIDAIKDASEWVSGRFLRKLFVLMLLTNSIAIPSRVWEATSQHLSEDMLYRQMIIHKNPCMSF